MAKEFERTPAGGGDTLPIVDTTAVVKGSVDATKLVRIEADGLTTSTTRVIIMPDEDVTLNAAASESAAGIAEIATQAEADTGTDDVRFITALKLDNRLQSFRGVNAQTGTGYTAVAGDAGQIITMDNAGANTVTLNDSVFAAGDVITILQKGAGATTVDGSASNNVDADKTLVLGGQWALATAIILVAGATTISVVDGNLVPV